MTQAVIGLSVWLMRGWWLVTTTSGTSRQIWGRRGRFPAYLPGLCSRRFQNPKGS